MSYHNYKLSQTDHSVGTLQSKKLKNTYFIQEGLHRRGLRDSHILLRYEQTIRKFNHFVETFPKTEGLRYN
jgi:hypothetical protein